ncbi:MAG: hypothetical protein HC800_07950 [Phormidesmis sp. RL_2_1]|nr:hypothetical protein [Phormidesmis sp. RL_2_1]
MQQLYDEDFRQFVEVGPSGNLTAFVTDILRGQKDWLGIASNQRQKPGLETLQLLLGQLFTQGMTLDWHALFPAPTW